MNMEFRCNQQFISLVIMLSISRLNVVTVGHSYKCESLINFYVDVHLLKV